MHAMSLKPTTPQKLIQALIQSLETRRATSSEIAIREGGRIRGDPDQVQLRMGMGPPTLP